MQHTTNDEALLERIDACHSRVSGAQRDLVGLIAEVDRRGLWRDSGARDTAHWLAMRYGVSEWKARRWIAASHALEGLPRLSRAFSIGEIGIDKVVELARFATAETEAGLIGWAKSVSCGCIRRRADVAARQAIQDVRDAERTRSLTWWYFDEGRRFGLGLEAPAACGPAIVKAIERVADELPVMPGEEDACYVDARRADALLALCSRRLSEDPDPDRATVVVHAPLEALVSADRGCRIEGGGVLHPETARRLLCDARVQTVIEDGKGDVVGLGRTSRVVPPWMIRQLRYRDRECRFPGCGARRFTQAHHVIWWEQGGRTDLENLVLLCFFHHKLVHEHGWALRREEGAVRWFHPDGTRYRTGPSPPLPSVPLDCPGWPSRSWAS